MPLQLIENPKPIELERPFLRGERSAGETDNILKALGLAKQHRFFDCQSYDDCLSQASKQNWKGWSCRHCPFWWSREP